MAPIIVTTVKDVLGRERPVTRTYGDGSVDCPFCTYAIVVPNLTCGNPWCVAHPSMPVARAQETVDAAAREAEAGLRRMRDAHAARECQLADHAARKRVERADLDEAAKRGACTRCLGHYHATGAGKKFTRHLHRPCPRNN